MIRVILHGADDLAGQAHAARVALRDFPENKTGDILGLRWGTRSYGIRWGRNSISVWPNPPTPSEPEARQ